MKRGEIMASGFYSNAQLAFVSGTIHLPSDTLKVALLDENHDFNDDNTTWADISDNEITGTNYTAGGKSLINLAVTPNQDGLVIISANNPTWSSATFTAHHAVIYDVTAGGILLCSYDFGANRNPISEDFTINWDAVYGVMYVGGVVEEENA
jgi:hypothetical protein